MDETTIVSASNLLNKEQMELLQNMFSKTHISQSLIVAEGLIAHKGNFSHVFTTKRELFLWIIDLGASDHMTGNINANQCSTM